LAARPSSRQRQDPAAQGKGAYAHLSCTDVDDPTSFWWTDRENMIGESIEPEWDPLKLINTDRPDFTDVAAVVGDGVVQVESGYLRWRRTDDEVRKITESVPNVLVRVGHGVRFEYRIKWRGFVRSEITDRATGLQGVEDGQSDVELGFKWVVAEQEDLFPMQTVVTRLQLPVGSSEMSADRAEPGISYILNWQARRWWFFRINLGVDSLHQPTYSFVSAGGGVPVQPTLLEVDHDTWTEISQSFSSYMQLSKRIGMFAEWFAFSRHGSDDDHADHYHNYGLYYYLTPDMQLDARAGWRVGNHVDESFTAAGFSMRF
jgi:Putative MetA-pathway of phenol degradation